MRRHERVGSRELKEDRLAINKEEECCDMAAELIILYWSILLEKTRTRQFELFRLLKDGKRMLVSLTSARSRRINTFSCIYMAFTGGQMEG